MSQVVDRQHPAPASCVLARVVDAALLLPPPPRNCTSALPDRATRCHAGSETKVSLTLGAAAEAEAAAREASGPGIEVGRGVRQAYTHSKHIEMGERASKDLACGRSDVVLQRTRGAGPF